MDTNTVRAEQDSRSLPAGSCCDVILTEDFRDRANTAAIIDLVKVRRKEEELNAKIQRRKQVLENLPQRMVELREKTEEMKKLHFGYDIFVKEEDVRRTVEKAERVRQEGLQRDAEIKRLTEESAQLVVRTQELRRQVQRLTPYRDFMEWVLRMTKFEDVERLTGHAESLLHFRDKLCQRGSEAEEQVNQLKKARLTLEDQHHLLRLQKNNQLSQLQTELEEARSEALIWERKWNHVLETAAKKTLLLGRIKMAILNLYEMTEDMAEGEEGVDINDTEKQLDQVKLFIKDFENIVKQHQTCLSRETDGQKRKEQKRDTANKQNSLK